MNNASTDNGEPDWVKAQYQNSKLEDYKLRIREFEKQLQQIRKLEVKRSTEDKIRAKRRKKAGEEDENYLVDDYDSSDNSSKNARASSGFSSEVQKLLEAIGEGGPKIEATKASSDENVLSELNKTKIFFASRTHSQLSQFVGQLKLTEFPPTVPSQHSEVDTLTESIKQISLSSRKQLCIHKKVSKLRDISVLNDACLEMQKRESTSCEYLLSEFDPEDRIKSNAFRNNALSRIYDIEDLNQLGHTMSTCPYYESRKVVAQAEIVTLPYQLLIQRSARKTMNIDVRGSVVIIDEAHNLMDTLSSLYSVSVTYQDVQQALEGLEIYQSKFGNRLNGSNKIYLAQMVKVVFSLKAFMEKSKSLPVNETSPGKEIKPSNILQGTGDLVNMYKLEKYLDKSKLVSKVQSYLEKKMESEDKDKDRLINSDSSKPRSSLVLSKVTDFLLAINNPSSEGKVFYSRTEEKDLQLQYLLLDPSEHFREIVDEARCVILAGGTMEPVEDYLNYLFPYLKRTDVRLFSCGHVIPDENLSVHTLGQAVNGEELNFTFANRNSPQLIANLGKSILHLANVIPDGLVIFCPSYHYLEAISKAWREKTVWNDLSRKKKIFQEPRDASSVDKVLVKYSEEISNGGGAILLSVVGGKMSEGINFSDGLARGVIMIGLPFPNFMSAEIVAKRDYIESQVFAKSGNREQAQRATREFYENLCLRAVNQSIGRAIRHVGDYATIILIDKRYETNKIQCKLPLWIKGRLINDKTGTLPDILRDVSIFFKSKKR